jgi:hypothetical protein
MAGEQAERRRLADEAAARLIATLDVVLGERLVPEPGVKPDRYADGVVVNGFGLLERCPRRAAHPADDFTETVATARRRVALAALRRLGDDASPAADAATAVDEVLSERTDLARNLAAWVEQLDRAGRAAVAAAAITWCSSVQRLVGSDGSIRWADPSSASHWDVPDRLVRVSASYDAVRGGVVTGERLLLVADGAGGPSDRLRAAYLALVRTLGTRHAPLRVTLAAPSRGTMERIDVDEDLLTLAVDRVVEHVVVRADRDAAAPRPGRWCAHCHLLELCDEGRSFLAAPADAAASVAAPDT